MIYVGTSGWKYFWNPDGLKWYCQTGLNAVELNSSFYRFPFPKQVKSYSKYDLVWSIKVNRLITHMYKLNEKAISLFNKFLSLFRPLESKIKFYLLQLPPSFSYLHLSKLEHFLKKVNNEKIAVEFRNKSFYNKDWEKLSKKLNCYIVSIDSPEASKIVKTKEVIYLRIHGKIWYNYEYTRSELEKFCKRIAKENPKDVFVFFNNNHGMLKNSLIMKSLLCKYL